MDDYSYRRCNDWIVLQAKDSGYGVKAGQVFNWADSYCSKMVLGKGHV